MLEFPLDFSLLMKCELLLLSLFKHSCQYSFSSAFLAVHGPYIVYKICQKLVHLVLISYDQIHISIWQLYSETLPAVEWQVLEIIHFK